MKPDQHEADEGAEPEAHLLEAVEPVDHHEEGRHRLHGDLEPSGGGQGRRAAHRLAGHFFAAGERCRDGTTRDQSGIDFARSGRRLSLLRCNKPEIGVRALAWRAAGPGAAPVARGTSMAIRSGGAPRRPLSAKVANQGPLRNRRNSAARPRAGVDVRLGGAQGAARSAGAVDAGRGRADLAARQP